jgi:hypothetical protein
MKQLKWSKIIIVFGEEEEKEEKEGNHRYIPIQGLTHQFSIGSSS